MNWNLRHRTGQSLLAPEGLTPRPNDDEVEWFQLWDVDKIKDGLA